jgi:hypothetical protein
LREQQILENGTDCKPVSQPEAAPKVARLNRETFITSRLLEFCSMKKLTLQTGHPVEQWPLVIAKEPDRNFRCVSVEKIPSSQTDGGENG